MMNNATLITRLETINVSAQNTALKVLIDELRTEELQKGYSATEKERVKLALSLQEKAFKTAKGCYSYTRTAMLGLYNKTDDDTYTMVNMFAAYALKVNRAFIEQSKVKTTDDDFTYFDKKGAPIYTWVSEKSKDNYPKTNGIWFKKSSANKTFKVNVNALMTWLKVNKGVDPNTKTDKLGKFVIDDSEYIVFNMTYLYEIMVISGLNQKEKINIYYLHNRKPFMLEEIGLLTPCATTQEDYQTHELKETPTSATFDLRGQA